MGTVIEDAANPNCTVGSAVRPGGRPQTWGVIDPRNRGLPGLICIRSNRRNWAEDLEIARKPHPPEQVGYLLRQVEVSAADGRTTAQSAKEVEIPEQTYYRWRREYGGLQAVQEKRLKELEQENAKLRRLVANLSLDNLALQDFARGNF